jgi:hypothetical protein
MTTIAPKIRSISCSLLLVIAAGCSDDTSPSIDSGSGQDATLADLASPDLKAMDAAADVSVPDTLASTDSAAPDKQLLDSAAAKDMAALADLLFKSIKCGAKSTCTTDEYCQKWVPGMPGGTYMYDAGVCPPDCSPVSGKPGYCTCLTYTCKKRPTGCNKCSCLTLTPGCSCVYSASKGGLFVDCYAP